MTGVSHGYWKHEYALTGTECYGQGGETASVNVASHCERMAWMFNDTFCGYQNLNKKSLKSRYVPEHTNRRGRGGAFGMGG